MKILNFFIAATAINAQQVDNDVNVASLAENLDKIKFELNEILLSRDSERDHLEVFHLSSVGFTCVLNIDQSRSSNSIFNKPIQRLF